jgi:hypothetical protein
VITLRQHHAPSTSSRLRTLRAAILASVLAVACVAPATALASGSTVVSDCALDSKLDKTYTAKEYKDALKNIPTDVDEYTDCRDVIRRAQLAAAGGGKKDSGGGDSTGGTAAGGGGASGGSAGTGGGAGAPSTTGVGGFDAVIAAASPQERAAVDQAVGSGAPVLVAGQDLRPDSLGHGDLGALNSLPTPFVVVLLLLALGTLAALLPTLRSVVRTRRQRPLA